MRGLLVLVLLVVLLGGAPAGGAAATGERREFRSSVRTIDTALAARMTPSSWRPGCPVPLRDLRYLRVSVVRFDGTARQGELVVHENHARAVVGVFRRLYDAGFPIRRMRLVDDYGGSDAASMAANNTSAFNCRRTTSGSSWSEHAYGRAIDINPVQNPYVAGDVVEPPAGEAYVERSPLRRGMVTREVRAAFRTIGWVWGGSWTTRKDYQHFSSTGR